MSKSTKALSLLLGALTMLSLFSLVVTVRAAAQPGTGTWNTTTVDGPSVGEFASLALDANGYPHISYYDDWPNYDLKYAYQDGTGWHNTTVDSAGDVGAYTSIALDANGYPHVSYMDYTNADLKYAYQDAGGWHNTTVDSGPYVGYGTSIALDSHGYPHISYGDGTNYDLKYAYQDGTGWHTTTVDSEGMVGGYNSLKLDANGYPHISYYDATNYGLKYAYQDAGGWHNTTIDSERDVDVGRYNSLKLDANGYPHISYMDYTNYYTNQDLKYAYQDAGGWHNTTVDSVGEYTSLALDSHGYPHISYYDDTNHNLKYAYQDATGWQTTTVEGAGNWEAFTSIALDANGYPHISYMVGSYANGYLKYAHWVPSVTLTATASPTTVTVNQNFKINGTLNVSTGGIGNATITLQRSTDNATWNNVTTKQTGLAGNYQLSKNESAAGSYYYRTAYDGNTTYANATSNIAKVTVTAAPTPLTVTAIDPANNTANVPVTKAVNVTFNKTVQQGTNYSNIALKKGTVKVNATATIAGTNLTIKPNATLAYSTAYTVFIPKEGVKNGTQTMMSDFTSKFTTVAAPKTPTTLNATVSKTAATVKQNFTIKGRLTASSTGIGYKTITLQRSTDNRTFTTLTTRVTNGTGWYQFSRNETTARAYYYRTTYAGNATTMNATSKVVKVTVTKKLTGFSIATSPAKPTFNTAFTVSGTLKSGTPGLAGLSVHLERKIGSGSWTTVAGTTKNTGTGGAVSVSQTITTHNTYSYRWHFMGTGTYQSCYSPVKTFTV